MTNDPALDPNAIGDDFDGETEQDLPVDEQAA